MKYVTPTIELQLLSTEDIMALSVEQTATYGASVGFWDGTEIEL